MLPVVLLVEDHEDTRLMYAAFMTGRFDVRQAADGRQALAAMRDARPDVVVTDLSLPGMDGFELAAIMRADPVLAGVPIICLSGYGGHVHEERGRIAGCDRMLQKPCMPDELADEVTDLLRKSLGRKVTS
jgi:two-component system, cell cycle response regulator DivK